MPGPVLVPDTFWIEEPVFLFYRTHTGNYMHALVDDYLGSSPRFLPAIRAAMHVHPACALGPWACWQTMRLLAAFFLATGMYHMFEHYYNQSVVPMFDPEEEHRRLLTVDGRPEHVCTTRCIGSRLPCAP
jgi:hypothetical protein